MATTSSLATRRCLAAACFLLAGVATGQQTLIVDAGNGPGTDETDIQPAVNRANPGDLIRVRPGTYSSFSLTRGIAIIGEPGALVGEFGIPSTPGDVLIENVPAGQLTQISGFTFIAGNITVRNCGGTVAIESMRSHLSLSPIVEVQDCADARIKSFFFGTATITRSSCTLVDISSAAATPFAAVSIDDSTVTITDSTVAARGAMFAAVPAVSVQNSVLFVQDSVLASTGSIGAASAVVGNGEVHFARTSVDGANAPGLAPTLTTIPTDYATVRTATPNLGGVLTVDIQGRPGNAFAPSVGLPRIPLGLGLGNPLAITPIASGAFGLLPANGLVSITFPVPNVPSLVGSTLAWQALTFDPAAIATTLGFSNASTHTIAP